MSLSTGIVATVSKFASVFKELENEQNVNAYYCDEM